jgi:hypothetical protein
MFTNSYFLESLVKLHQDELLADAEASRLVGLARRHGRGRHVRRHRATRDDHSDGVSHPVATLATCVPRAAA